MADDRTNELRWFVAVLTVGIAFVGLLVYSIKTDELSVISEETVTTLAVGSVFELPVGRQFYTVYMVDEDVHEWCDVNFPNDLVGCYDAYERGTTNFEATTLNAWRQIIVPDHLRRESQGRQHGCDSNGRCEDAYGWRCDENDLVFSEVALETVCDATALWLAEEAASDYLDNQNQPDFLP